MRALIYAVVGGLVLAAVAGGPFRAEASLDRAWHGAARRAGA